MKRVPCIRFYNVNGRMTVECDGETVGVFYPDQTHNRGEQFMRNLEQLKMLMNDEIVDTFKYMNHIRSIVAEQKEDTKPEETKPNG